MDREEELKQIKKESAEIEKHMTDMFDLAFMLNNRNDVVNPQAHYEKLARMVTHYMGSIQQSYGYMSVKVIEALEQEPCEDAISRQAVIDGIEELKKSPWATDKRGFGFEYLIKEALEVVADLCVKQAPSVNPQEPKYCDRNICIKNEYNGIGCDECEVTKSQEPKTGHWIYIGNKDINHSMKIVECDSCHKRNYGSSDYCPNCGAKMVEPQESEDKE